MDEARAPHLADGEPPLWSLEHSLKDFRIEELIDWHFHRALAFQLIRPLRGRAEFITPFRITILSLVVGVAGGLCCFLAPTHGTYLTVVGGVLVFLSVILDCADGQLARLRGGGTRFGMLLDGFVDYAVGLSFWFGLSYGTVYGWNEWWVWPGCCVVLASILFHVVLYDRYKNIFLGACTEPDSPNPGVFERVVAAAYYWFSGTLFKTVDSEPEEVPAVEDERFHKRFQEALTAPMRLVSFLGLGTHLFIMYTATIVGAFDPRITFWAAQFLVTGVLNVVATLAVVRWRAAARQVARS